MGEPGRSPRGKGQAPGYSSIKTGTQESEEREKEESHGGNQGGVGQGDNFIISEPKHQLLAGYRKECSSKAKSSIKGKPDRQLSDRQGSR